MWCCTSRDRFQRKINEILKEWPNVFGTAGDIEVAGYTGYNRDSTDHDKTLWRVLKICRKHKIKHRQMPFQDYKHPLFGEIVSRHGILPHPYELIMLMQMLHPKLKRKSFLGTMNYVSKYSVTSEIWEPLRRLVLVKSRWTWNNTYKEIYDTTKILRKKDMCMKFYD